MTADLETLRARVRTLGRRLVLPDAWLAALPNLAELPGDHRSPDYQEQPDVFLAWKAQEHRARTGRLAEVDPVWLAEALHDAAIADGPGALDAALDEILFLMVWPRRTYMLDVELGRQLELLEGCLQDSPSIRLFERDIARVWRIACHEAYRLDSALRQLLDTPCPWATFDDLIAAVQTRLAEDRAARLDDIAEPSP